MRRVFVVALLALAAFVRVAAAESMVIRVSGGHDAPVHVHFDPDPVEVYADPGDVDLGPNILLAPSGRTEERRPAPGVVEETRAVLEFSLVSLVTSYAAGLDEARLVLPVDHVDGAPPTALRFAVRGRPGDACPDVHDFGLPCSDAVCTSLGVVGVQGVGEVTLDVTAFLNDLLARGELWAAFCVHVDLTCLPDRESLPGETVFGAGLAGSEIGSGAELRAEPRPAARQVQAMSAIVLDHVAAGLMGRSTANSLLAQLEGADRSLANGHQGNAANHLHTFINHLETQMKNEKIPSLEGWQLVNYAWAVIRMLGEA